jgi:hypothetical protein
MFVEVIAGAAHRNIKYADISEYTYSALFPSGICYGKPRNIIKKEGKKIGSCTLTKWIFN